MEKHEIELLERLIAHDVELRERYLEHRELEKRLGVLAGRLHLSVEEDLERKELQKRKLAGKDRMMQILNRHRAQASCA